MPDENTMDDAPAQASDVESLARISYQLRNGGAMRIDEDLSTSCVSPHLAALIADAIDKSIGVQMTVAPNGLVTVQPFETR